MNGKLTTENTERKIINHRGHGEKEHGDSKKKNKPQRAQRDFLIVKKE
jgi:hypothetical protein